jgi:putative oxidoreductase
VFAGFVWTQDAAFFFTSSLQSFTNAELPPPMQHLFTTARILLGLIFLVFSLNYWLKFIPIPAPAAESLAAGFMGAIYGSGFLTFVKVLELVSAVLLLSGRYINLALTLLGPVVVNILLFHVMIKQSDHAPSVVIVILALVVLVGQKNYLRAIFAK